LFASGDATHPFIVFGIYLVRFPVCLICRTTIKTKEEAKKLEGGNGGEGGQFSPYSKYVIGKWENQSRNR
jgi:hypothetical protein